MPCGPRYLSNLLKRPLWPHQFPAQTRPWIPAQPSMRPCPGGGGSPAGGGPPSPRAALLCLPPGSTLFAALPQPCWQSPSLFSCLPAQDCCVGTVIAPSGHPLLPLPRVHGVAPLVSGMWAPQHPGGRVPGDGAGSRTPLPTCVRKEACCALGGMALILGLTNVITFLCGSIRLRFP